MPSIAKRWLFCFVGAIFILYTFSSWHGPFEKYGGFLQTSTSSSVSKWRKAQNIRYPIKEYAGLPAGSPKFIPRIQTVEHGESPVIKQERLKRLDAVKEAMVHSWKGYKAYAWLKDEVTPVSGSSADTFGGWAATLVDSLDTLWIMDMKDEFYEALGAVSKIDFGSSSQSNINVFETTIRYLGGFLSAYDLSGEKILLEKATELGEMLYVAFDTPNRMPITRWNWKDGLNGRPQQAPGSAVVAEIASLCLEFTRLSQVTGDSRFYDAIDRITIMMATQQQDTMLPGLWPVSVNARTGDFMTGHQFTIGAMADSAYEYLPKMFMILGGHESIYRRMYERSLEAMKKHIFFSVPNPENKDIMFPGDARVDPWLRTGQQANESELTPTVQHLGCYAGGMIGIGAKLFGSKPDERVARALTDGCIWAYESAPNGIMPEMFKVLPCERETNPECVWNEETWLNESMRIGSFTSEEYRDGLAGAKHYTERIRIPPGMLHVSDPRYLLRPEAIESVFIMYRLTGDRALRDHGWKMFSAIAKQTRTKIAHAAVKNVMAEDPGQIDNMESFWTAETLKYFYLLFSDASVISLDEYVFNTEAHPFKRPVAGSKSPW